ncbi:hypothetical protein DL98DRAFT_595669 [Cadophora sp. DSE1049]|nr:hypothetical protein DL98DRAFT_595669 [Cadophora sp. DSE1049]
MRMRMRTRTESRWWSKWWSKWWSTGGGWRDIIQLLIGALGRRDRSSDGIGFIVDNILSFLLRRLGRTQGFVEELEASNDKLLKICIQEKEAKLSEDEKNYFSSLFNSTAPKDANGFLKANYFGVFFSLLDDIVRFEASAPETDSDIYFEPSSPVSNRTRGAGARWNTDNTPSKGPNPNRLMPSVENEFAKMSLEDSEGEQESPSPIAATTPPSTNRSAKSPPSTTGSLWTPEQKAVKVIAEDEAIVNTCILNFLMPLQWIRNSGKNISAVRKQFVAFSKTSTQYIACVNGLIMSCTDRNAIIGFIEAKRALRCTAVRIQEIAEMVAFISHFRKPLTETWKGSNGHGTFIVGICAHMVYITIATWTPKYCKFLDDFYENDSTVKDLNMTGVDNTAFAKMTEYNFNLNKARDRKDLVRAKIGEIKTLRSNNLMNEQAMTSKGEPSHHVGGLWRGFERRTIKERQSRHLKYLKCF